MIFKLLVCTFKGISDGKGTRWSTKYVCQSFLSIYMSCVFNCKVIFFIITDLKSNTVIFEGTNHFSKYSYMFLNIIQEYEVELEVLGGNSSDLGIHSCSKFVATIVSAGCSVSPPIISLCISCRCYMGRFKERYLKYEVAEDEYLVPVLLV